MDRDTLSGPAFPLWPMAMKEESGVFLVWSSSTRARQSRNRRTCNHSATIEVQEAPSGTRTGLTSLPRCTCSIASS